MTTNSNKEINVSISRDFYENKETINRCLVFHKDQRDYPQGNVPFSLERFRYDQLAFGRINTTISRLVEDYLIKGYAACHIFDTTKTKNGLNAIYEDGRNEGYMRIAFKTEEFFKSADFICMDIDYSECKTIDEFLDRLPMKPSAWYKSYSHMADKGKEGVSIRLHLFFVLDETITSIDEYKRVASAIGNYVSGSTASEVDKHLYSPAQYFNGCFYKKGDREFGVSDIVYSVDDFKEYETIDGPRKEIIKLSSDELTDYFSTELLNIYENDSLSNKDVLGEFITKGWTCSAIEDIEENEDNFYTLVDNGLLVSVKPRIRKNKNSGKVNIVRFKDGEHRRDKLQAVAHAYRMIHRNKNNKTCADNIALSLLWYLVYAVDNSEDEITRDELLRFTILAMDKDIDSIVKMFCGIKRYKKNFIINKDAKRKGNVRVLVGKARTEITDNKIAELYDFSASIADNLKVLNENGVKVSQRRLYKWCESNRVDTKPKKVKYNPSLSRQENIAAGVPSATVDRYIKKQKLSKF